MYEKVLDQIEARVGEGFLDSLAKRAQARFQTMTKEERLCWISAVYDHLSGRFRDIDDLSQPFHEWLSQYVIGPEEADTLPDTEFPDADTALKVEPIVLKDLVAAAGGNPDDISSLEAAEDEQEDQEAIYIEDEAVEYVQRVSDIADDEF